MQSKRPSQCLHNPATCFYPEFQSTPSHPIYSRLILILSSLLNLILQVVYTRQDSHQTPLAFLFSPIYDT